MREQILRGAHLVGSVPLANNSEVFTLAAIESYWGIRAFEG